MMPDYKMKYKCRMCGEEFYDAITGNEKIAFGTLVMLTTGKAISNLDVNCTGMTNVHITGDHYGIADLMGCEIIGGEEENG